MATVQGILNMLNKQDTIYSLPVGYGYQLLAECRESFNKKNLSHLAISIELLKKSLQKISHKINTRHQNKNTEKKINELIFNPDAWYCAIDHLKKEPFLTNIIKWADLVVINGEGTIHHNYYGSQILLALALIATEYKKNTILVNATIESIDNTMIKESLSKINYISVRDNYSKQYLKSFSIECKMHPDAAFSNNYIDFPQFKLKKDKPNCLISSGIEQSTTTAANLINIVQRNGYEPIYCCFDNSDDSVYRYCRTNKIEVIHHATIPWWCFPSFLNQFDLCLSGRHHLNVFCILGKTPFVPLSSNTWKIQGTLDLIDYPFRISNNEDEVECTIQRIAASPNIYNDNLVNQVINKSKLMINDYFKT